MTILLMLVAVLMQFPNNAASKIASNETKSTYSLMKFSFERQIYGAIFGLVLALFGGGIVIDGPTVFYAFLFGTLLVITMLIKLFAVRYVSMGLASLFVTAGVIVPCLFGIFFLDQKMSALQWLMVAIFIFSSTMVVSASGGEKKKLGIKGVLLLLGLLVFNGLGSVVLQLFGTTVPDGSVFTFMGLAYAMGAVPFGIWLLVQKKENREKVNRKTSVCAAVIAVACLIFQVIVTELTPLVPSGILFPGTSGSNVLVGTLVGMLCFKEKITPKMAAGLLLGTVALIWIGL